MLTCCHEQGWEIERNFKYKGDGGLDGRVTIGGSFISSRQNAIAAILTLSIFMTSTRLLTKRKRMEDSLFTVAKLES